MLVVHEDNLICGFGAEVLAAVAENVSGELVMRRVARPDTFVPSTLTINLEVLPSFRDILASLARMLDFDLSWQLPTIHRDGALQFVSAIGSSPTDQASTVLRWKVQTGDHLAIGQSLAEMEADKAVSSICQPRLGRPRTNPRSRRPGARSALTFSKSAPRTVTPSRRCSLRMTSASPF